MIGSSILIQLVLNQYISTIYLTNNYIINRTISIKKNPEEQIPQGSKHQKANKMMINFLFRNDQLDSIKYITIFENNKINSRT